MITVDCSPVIKALALLWLLLPLLTALIVPALFSRGAHNLVLQESRIFYLWMGAIGGGWMLLGLGLVPFLGAHGASLARALLMAVGWSAAAGAWLGPSVVELRYRPLPSAVGEPVEFRPSGSAGHMVQLSPTSGDAASARFLVPQVWWNPTYARAGNKPVKGKVYKGGGDLWFADLEDQESGGPQVPSLRPPSP